MKGNDDSGHQFLNSNEIPGVFELRGYHVMPEAKVAEAFEVETRQIV